MIVCLFVIIWYWLLVFGNHMILIACFLAILWYWMLDFGKHMILIACLLAIIWYWLLVFGNHMVLIACFWQSYDTECLFLAITWYLLLAFWQSYDTDCLLFVLIVSCCEIYTYKLLRVWLSLHWISTRWLSIHWYTVNRGPIQYCITCLIISFEGRKSVVRVFQLLWYFGRHISSCVAKAHAKFQSDTSILTPNLITSRLCKILR